MPDDVKLISLKINGKVYEPMSIETEITNIPKYITSINIEEINVSDNCSYEIDPVLQHGTKWGIGNSERGVLKITVKQINPPNNSVEYRIIVDRTKKAINTEKKLIVKGQHPLKYRVAKEGEADKWYKPRLKDHIILDTTDQRLQDDFIKL